MEKEKEIKIQDLFGGSQSQDAKTSRFSDTDNYDVKIYNNRKYLVRRKKKV